MFVVSAQQPNLGGMTVNERLVLTGLVQQFETAIHSRDRRAAVDVPLQVALSEATATATVDAVFDNPTKYGY